MEINGNGNKWKWNGMEWNGMVKELKWAKIDCIFVVRMYSCTKEIKLCMRDSYILFLFVSWEIIY